MMSLRARRFVLRESMQQNTREINVTAVATGLWDNIIDSLLDGPLRHALGPKNSRTHLLMTEYAVFMMDTSTLGVIRSAGPGSVSSDYQPLRLDVLWGRLSV